MRLTPLVFLLTLACAPEDEADSQPGDTDPQECFTAGHCTDDEPCNGLEFCYGGDCAPGDPPPDGTECESDGNHATVEHCSDMRCR